MIRPARAKPPELPGMAPGMAAGTTARSGGHAARGICNRSRAKGTPGIHGKWGKFAVQQWRIGGNMCGT